MVDRFSGRIESCPHTRVHDCSVVVRVVEPSARLLVRCDDVPGWRCDDCGYEDPTAAALERVHDLVLCALSSCDRLPMPGTHSPPQRRPPR